MRRVTTAKRRFLLGFAALSPGVALLAFRDAQISVELAFLGLVGALGLICAVIATSIDFGEKSATPSKRNTEYPSLLLQSALKDVRSFAPDPPVIRAALRKRIEPGNIVPAFVTQDEHVAMVLSQIMSRWDATDVGQLSDDQARELWLVERLMRASPAEAGALSDFFAAPNAMLTIRDSIASPISA